jgi:hypothetical protein
MYNNIFKRRRNMKLFLCLTLLHCASPYRFSEVTSVVYSLAQKHNNHVYKTALHKERRTQRRAPKHIPFAAVAAAVADVLASPMGKGERFLNIEAALRRTSRFSTFCGRICPSPCSKLIHRISPISFFMFSLPLSN